MKTVSTKAQFIRYWKAKEFYNWDRVIIFCIKIEKKTLKKISAPKVANKMFKFVNHIAGTSCADSEFQIDNDNFDRFFSYLVRTILCQKIRQ